VQDFGIQTYFVGRFKVTRSYLIMNVKIEWLPFPLFIGPESKFPIFKLNSMLCFMSKNGKNCRTIPFTILLFLSTFSKRQKLRIPAVWKLLIGLPVMLVL